MENVINNLDIQSNSIDVYGSRIHYLEVGEGDPILFLHGMPTSSYLWRNIIPGCSKNGRCIALDFIGMGKSSKPHISYTIDDHIKYLSGFIKELGLKNITLVMHAWGSVIGFEYARQNQNNIRGLAFYESHVKTSLSDDEVSLPVAEYVSMLKYEDNIYKKVVEDNFIVNNFLNTGMVNNLSDDEVLEYTNPFKTTADRMVLLQYVNELPFGKKANRVSDIINIYSKYLQESKVPKLFLYSIPGFTTTVSTISWAKDNLPNITVSDLGDGMHFSQESNPEIFVKKLNFWLENI